MRERMTRLLLLGTGLGMGVLLQPLLVGQAHGGEDPLIAPPPSTAQAAQAPSSSWEAVEYNMYLPPPNPKVEKLVAKMDELGKNGWRLVSTTTSNGGTSGFIFMRARH